MITAALTSYIICTSVILVIFIGFINISDLSFIFILDPFLIILLCFSFISVLVQFS